MLAGRELRVRYRQSVLDTAWGLLNPVAILAVYGYILTESFSVEARCGTYLASAWSGLVLWTFFSTAVSTASTSIIASRNLVTKLKFPVDALPLSMVLVAGSELVFGGATVGVLVIAQGAPRVSWATAAVLGALGVLVVWTATISLLVGVVSVFARDLVHAVQLLLRVGFFATPVVYESGFIPDRLAWTGRANPVAVAIEGVRDALLCGTVPDGGLIATHLGVGALALVAVMLYARAVEIRIPDVV